MAELREIGGRLAGTAHIVDLDRSVLGERLRVDEHERKSGSADVLDLGVILAQTDRDHAVDRRPGHRPDEAAPER